MLPQCWRPALWLLTVGLVSPGPLTAQISSVTRPTLQMPLTFFAPAPGANPATPPPAWQPTPLPRSYAPVVLPARPLKTEAERAQDAQRLLDFQHQCAEQGLRTFQYDLGLRYLVGKGVPRDRTIARHWLERAAAQRHPRARLELERLNRATSAPSLAPAPGATAGATSPGSAVESQPVEPAVRGATGEAPED